METIHQATLDFIHDLSLNNDREWFAANRSRYEAARANFSRFVQAQIDQIITFEPMLKGLEAGNCIFRINRDTRFSRDKSLYKNNMGAFIVRGGKRNGDRFPGYYIHLEPGASFIAGGAYLPPSPWLNEIRRNISEHGDRLEEIVSGSEFRKWFGSLTGESLKGAPRGYSLDHPGIELLMMKSFLAEHSFTDSEVTSPRFSGMVAEAFRAMNPLNNFLLDGR